MKLKKPERKKPQKLFRKIITLFFTSYSNYFLFKKKSQRKNFILSADFFEVFTFCIEKVHSSLFSDFVCFAKMKFLLGRNISVGAMIMRVWQY